MSIVDTEAQAGSPAQVGDTCDKEVFKNVIGHFTSGVTVITARHDSTDYGMTASAVTSLSMDPPMLLVCVNERNPTGQAISKSGSLAVNILDESQADLAEQFARPDTDKFAGVERSYGRLGEPVLGGALAYLECHVDEEVKGGTHLVFLSKVKNAVASEGSPLTYFRGTFGRFLQAQDDSLYADLRNLVLSRETAVGRQLDIEDLAARMNADRGAVYHALTRLAGEGLLERQQGGGYNVVALDAGTLADASEARLVMELGVAEATVGVVSDEDVAALRRHAEETAAYIQDGAFVDLERYIESNRAFHEHQIGLVGNEALTAAYRRLSLEGILLRSFRTQTQGSDAMIEDHRCLAEAYETGDLEQAKTTIKRHSARSRELGRKAAEAAGGEL